MIGTTLGPYRIDAELGSGGMGRVWRATVVGPAQGLATGAVVALKVIHPHLLETAGFFKRFLREAEIGKSIVHENVVRTFDADAVGIAGVQHHFIVVEYVEGQTLRALADEMGRVPEELCRHAGREIAKGLAAIHAAGAVHRDMKPDNVLITREHVVKVMDLGVARLADEQMRLSQSGTFVGSIQYAAPEQFHAAGDVDARADLHALGVVLYELATGRHPFVGDGFRGVMHKVLFETPRRCAEINPQLSPFFEEVVHRLLAKRREDRFASADELARVLGDGETSAWWKDHANSIRAATKRPLRRIRIPRETALYGREAEMTHLRSLFERASAGAGLALLVEGEAGIGKSRLVDEFVGVLQRDGEDVNFLFGSYPPGGAATAAGAFSTAYREQFGESGSSPWLAQTPILVPAFDALLRGEPPPAGSEPLTKDSLQTCFVHATRNLALERPTIVLVDDLHFAPREGRALFAALALAVPGHRALLVGTARPGLDEKWLAELDRIGAGRMQLARLGPKDLGRLLVDALKSEATANELALQIATKSDGNPFFVFEILRGLRDGQFLARREDGTWVTTRVIGEIRIPSTVRDLVNARVSDLTPGERDILDIAACVGFEFDPLLVGEAAGTARIPTLKRLAQIERAHRLVRAAGTRYVFDHHQVQEALYGSLSEPLRAEYHAALAEALEARSGAASREPASLDGALCVDVAEHFLKGGAGARSLRYLGVALTHLEKGYLNDAAIRLADRALAVPGLVPGRERAELLLRKGVWLEFLGRSGDQSAALEEAAALADRDGDPALRGRARRSLGNWLYRAARYDEAGAVLREALGLARTAGDRYTEASVLGILGSIAWTLARFAEALDLHAQHLALSRATGNGLGESAAHGNLSIVYRALGRFAEAIEHTEQFLAIARARGDRRGEALATGNIGNSLIARGRFAEALSYYERHLALARQIGDRRSEGLAMGNLGDAHYWLGRHAEALSYCERTLALAREIGDRKGEILNGGNLGSVLSSLGRFAAAREHLEASLALAREIGEREGQGFALHALAEIAADEEDAPEAERRFAEALGLRREIGQRAAEAETLRVRATWLARQGRAAEAQADLAAALALIGAERVPGIEVLAKTLLATLPGGDVAAALAALSVHEERLGMAGAMEARFLLWQATHDPSHLAEARRRLDLVVAHAPPDCREPMLANVRLCREIAAAWEIAEAGKRPG